MFIQQDRKKEETFRRVAQILKENEVNGVSKNELCRSLESICSRMTFYKYWKEMIDPNGANIIEMRKTGPQQEKCFPTKNNQQTEQLLVKMETVKKLLDLIQKTPQEGDYLIFTKSQVRRHPSIQDFNLNDIKSDMIDVAKIKNSVESTDDITFYNFGARHDVLRALPYFLINYVNEKRNGYSKQIREHSLQLMTPLITKCFDIFQKEYSETLSNRIHKILPSQLQKNKINVIWLKNYSQIGVKVDFLKVLTRYYFGISVKHSKKLEFEQSAQQRIISNVIQNFFTKIPREQESGIQEHLALVGEKPSHPNMALFPDDHEFPSLHHAYLFAHDFMFAKNNVESEISKYCFELLRELKIVNLDDKTVNFITKLKHDSTYLKILQSQIIENTVIS